MKDSKSFGHRISWPSPKQDEHGNWWFFDPEMGWQNKEEQDKIRKAFSLSMPTSKIAGKIVFFGTAGGDDNNNFSFKDLLDKSIAP